MARIQAGSTLVNQYAPPFVVDDSVANGWVLQWNETYQAFEAVDPDANTVYAGFDSIQVYRVENANQQTFVAPFATDSKESTFITIDGVGDSLCSNIAGPADRAERCSRGHRVGARLAEWRRPHWGQRNHAAF